MFMETNLTFTLNSNIVMKQMLHESIIARLGLGIAHSSLYECHYQSFPISCRDPKETSKRQGIISMPNSTLGIIEDKRSSRFSSFSSSPLSSHWSQANTRNGNRIETPWTVYFPALNDSTSPQLLPTCMPHSNAW